MLNHSHCHSRRLGNHASASSYALKFAFPAVTFHCAASGRAIAAIHLKRMSGAWLCCNKCELNLFPCTAYLITYKFVPPLRQVRHALPTAAHWQPMHPWTYKGTNTRIIFPTTLTKTVSLVRTSPPHAVLSPCTKGLWTHGRVYEPMAGRRVQEVAPKQDGLIEDVLPMLLEEVVRVRHTMTPSDCSLLFLQ